jgi:UDP:flavonoid glycosyltransferase YjiC (YdhE family)
MKVLLTTTQGEGHVRPLLAYAQALARLGHDVAVAAPDDATAILGKAGLEHHPFPGMTSEEFTAFWAPHWARNVTRDATMKIAVPDMFIRLRARRALPVLKETVERWRPDLILRESHEFAGLILAQAHDIPHVRVNVSNCEVEAKVIDFGAEAVDEMRSEARLAPDGGAALWGEPVYTAFPFGFDGHARHGPGNPPFRVGSRISGPPPATDWVPKGDQPLVYVTFGTMVGARPGRDNIFRVALDAVADLNVEVLMTTGRDFDISALGAIPDNAVVRHFIPQAAVFRHSTAMLCHGGSGTLLGGFAAGLPQVVAPHSADQPYNADLVATGGFGLHVNASSPDEMRTALNQILSRPDFTQAAHRLGNEMQTTPSHEVAVERIAALA